MATTKITSNVLALSAAQTNINNDGSFTLSVPTLINNTVSVSGNLTVDTNTLFVDSVNNRVGIGTTTPSKNLEILSSQGNCIRINNNVATFDISIYTDSSLRTLQSGGYGSIVDATGHLTIGNTPGTGSRDLFVRRIIGTPDAAGAGISINGAVSQSANYMNVTSSGGTAGNIFNILSNGNVGIGTATPSTPLHTYTAGNNSLTIEAGTGDSQVMLRSGGSQRFLFGYEDADDGFRIYNNTTASTALFVKSTTGNVGIGTTTPNEKLHIYDSVDAHLKIAGADTAGSIRKLSLERSTGGAEIHFNEDTRTTQGLTLNTTNAAYPMSFQINGDTKMFVSTAGSVGIGTTAPSARLHAIATTEQLRVGYDASNYLSTTVNSTGVTTLSAVGSGAKFAFSNNVEVTAAGGVAGSTIKIGGSGMALGFAAGGSSYSGVWCNNATPDFSNYTFLGDGNDSFFNAKATGKNYFRTGNTNRMMVDQNGVFIPGVGTNANPTTQQLTVIPSAASKIGAVIKGFTSQTANLIEWQDSAGVVLASVTASGNISTTGHFSAATKSFKIPHQSKGGHLQYGVVESDCHSVLVRGKISSDTITLPEHWSWLVDADSVTVQLTPVGCYQQLYIVSSDNQTVKVGGVTGEYCYVVYGTRKDVAPLEVEIE
jgi:hypothetical protein